MRVPPSFRPTDETHAWEVMRRHGFATLVTAAPGEAPIASPLPFLAHERERVVESHLARDNAQVAHLGRDDVTALVLFSGPSAFVSASAYRQGPAVPTWNHVTVHVSGRPTLIGDEPAVLDVLRRTVAHFEAEHGSGWRLDVADPYMGDLARAVIGFRVAAERIDAAFKLSQNVDATARRQVAAWLADRGEGAVVAAMHEVAESEPPR